MNLLRVVLTLLVSDVIGATYDQVSSNGNRFLQARSRSSISESKTLQTKRSSRNEEKSDDKNSKGQKSTKSGGGRSGTSTNTKSNSGKNSANSESSKMSPAVGSEDFVSCPRGYSRIGDECVCTKECPANSTLRKHRSCPSSSRRHCLCNLGFEWDVRECVPAPVPSPDCPSGYNKERGFCRCAKRCPRGTKLRRRVRCPANIERHCLCRRGFKLEGVSCVRIEEINDLGSKSSISVTDGSVSRTETSISKTMKSSSESKKSLTATKQSISVTSKSRSRKGTKSKGSMGSKDGRASSD